jgi:peptide/nickel transport system permease protein
MKYLLRRAAAAVPTLLVVSIVVFVLQQMLPGDAAEALAGEERDPQVIAYIRAHYHLDQPLPVRYALWVWALLHGDFGESIRSHEPVLSLIATKLPVTVELAALAMAWALVIGIPMGVIAALRKGTVVDFLANAIGLSGYSIPHFWLGIMLILLVSVELGWLPASGYVSLAEDPLGNLRVMLMPSLVLGTNSAAVLMRHSRSAMIATLRTDYVRTARAKGLFERLVVLRHALRNALIPIITMGALQIGELLAGAVLTEQVFTIPGFGKLIVDGVFNRDFAVVQGVVLVTACAFILVNLLADLAYVLANPRIRV